MRGKGRKSGDNETTRSNFWDSGEMKLLLNGSARGSWPHIKPTGINWSRKCVWQTNINDWLHLLNVRSSFPLSRMILPSLLFFSLLLLVPHSYLFQLFNHSPTLPPSVFHLWRSSTFYCIVPSDHYGGIKSTEGKVSLISILIQDEFSVTVSRQKL